MQIEIKDSGPCRKTMEITYTSEDVKNEFEKVLGSYAKAVNIPGFRAGRAPRSLVKNKYGKKILEDVKDNLLGNGYRKAVKDNDISVVALLNVEGDVESVDTDVTFTVTLDVPPAFDMPEYKKIPIEAEAVEVDDCDVDKAIDDLRQRYATYTEVKDRPIAYGDFAMINYQGTQDGKPLEPPENGKAQILYTGKESWIPVSKDGQFMPYLVDGLVGCSIGDKKDIDVDLDQDEKTKALNIGKVTYQVEILDIRAQQLPELDEEFLEKMQVESAEMLRSEVTKDLERMQKDQEHVRQINKVIDALLDKASFDLPESVVQEETRRTIYDMVRANTQRGINEDVITEKKDEIFQAAEHSAKEKVKLRYILHRIAEDEKITVSQQEVASRIITMALQYGMDPKQVRAQLEKDDRIQDLESEIRERKTLDFLVEQADVSI